MPAALTYMGVSDGIQSTAGAMGAATLTNVILTPVHLSLLSFAVPMIAAKFNPMQLKFQNKLD